jgi:hypothetical protein
LLTTTQRLGAAVVSSESSAAHKYSNFHSQFMRASAAVAQNRKLAAGICRASLRNQFSTVSFDVSAGLAPTRNICQYHETLVSHNILNVIKYHIHIRFYYTTFSANAARQKRLINSGRAHKTCYPGKR